MRLQLGVAHRPHPGEFNAHFTRCAPAETSASRRDYRRTSASAAAITATAIVITPNPAKP